MSLSLVKLQGECFLIKNFFAGIFQGFAKIFN